MFPWETYWMWVTGGASASVSIGLDPSRSYLVTGALTGKDGSDYAQVYISMLCTIEGDQQLCGIRDVPPPDPVTSIQTLDIGEWLNNASSVTITLRTSGGAHRAEGVVWDITQI
jgi:hypothetical protein